MPRPHATAEEVAAARHDRKLANVLYHDWEAASYDDKWSISYDERCITYAADRFRHAVGHGDDRWPYGRALELGCGTGFFLLNLMQAGLTARGSVTDLSPGMVAAALRNAENLGLDVDGRVADAEQIPYDDATFDVVVGHAVLHHIPDLDTAFREVLRVLKPGGRFVFAGEPTRIGDRYARGCSAASRGRRPRRSPGCPRCGGGGGRRPSSTSRRGRRRWRRSWTSTRSTRPRCEALARGAGAADVRVVTEELSAAMLGWPVRTFEAAVPPDKLGFGWAMFAYRSWLRLSWLDEHVLARVVPRAWFYNALVTGTRPA